MAEFSLRAEDVLGFQKQGVPADKSAMVKYWDRVFRLIGPLMLPFLLKREALDLVPYDMFGLLKLDPAGLCPQPGEMWVLFCFRDSVREGAESSSPFRIDGFPLILEWRKGVPDSPLLSEAMHSLAKLVRTQQRVDGWGLHPANYRYQDKVEFTDSRLFGSSENPILVASAYGSLAAGLYCAVRDKYPNEWPFPTVLWDEDQSSIGGVEGLRQKLSVAVDCGAKVITVAREQRKQMLNDLKDCRSGKDGERFRRIHVNAVAPYKDYLRQASSIAFGHERKKAARTALASAMGMGLIAVTATGIWGEMEHQAKEEIEANRRFEQAVDCFNDVDDALFSRVPEGIEILESIKGNAGASGYLAQQRAVRSWLTPQREDPNLRMKIDLDARKEFYAQIDKALASGDPTSDENLEALIALAPPRIQQSSKGHYKVELEITGRIKVSAMETKRQLWMGPENSSVSMGWVDNERCVLVVDFVVPENRLTAFNLKTGDLLWQKRHSGLLKAAAFDESSGRLAVLSQQGQLSVLASQTGRKICETTKVPPEVCGLAFLDKGRELCLQDGIKGVVYGFSPNQAWDSLNISNGTVSAWRLIQNGAELSVDVTLLMSEAEIQALERRLVAGESVPPEDLLGSVERRFYDLRGNVSSKVEKLKEADLTVEKSRPSLPLTVKLPEEMDEWQVSQTGIVVAKTYSPRQLFAYDMNTGKECWRTRPFVAMRQLAFALDEENGLVACMASEKEVQLLDIRSGQMVAGPFAMPDGVAGMALGGKRVSRTLLVVGGGNDVRCRGTGYCCLIDMTTRRKLLTMKGAALPLQRVAGDAWGGLVLDGWDSNEIMRLKLP